MGVWKQGRALGNRSILASPLQPEAVDRLNATVKYREHFRPSASVVPEDKVVDYFTFDQPSPFMSIASGVTDLARTHILTAIHTNDTARVQTISRTTTASSTKLPLVARSTGSPGRWGNGVSFFGQSA